MPRPPAIPYEEIPKMKFGRLKPIRMMEGKGRTKWLCKCDCGNETIVTQKNLCNGNTKSCGCFSMESRRARNKGYQNKERLYIVWIGMRERCNNPNNNSYKWYGAIGVTVCEEWERDYCAFKRWALETGYDETLPRGAQTIERKDPNKDYSPENCEWKTIQQQQRNKRGSVLYEMNGEKHILREWSEILNVDYDLLRSRVGTYGWTLEQAISEPKQSKVNVKKIKIEYNGESLTIREWAQKLGISENTIRARMSKARMLASKDPEYILQTVKVKTIYKTIIEYNGKSQNLREWAKELGINYTTLKDRYKRGCSIEKLFCKENLSSKQRGNVAEG